MALRKTLLGVSLYLGAANGYEARSFPDSIGIQESTLVAPLGTNYSVANSQLTNNGGSWWSLSFIHGSNDHEYLIISHFLATPPFAEYYRASILDITEGGGYKQFTHIVNASTTTNIINSTFGYQAEDFFMGALTEDPLGKINTWSTVEGVSFNLTYDFQSPILFNGGLGSFSWANTFSNEWSVPSNPTSGTLDINGTTIDVVPDSSFTWYDRQWQTGSPANWTWFQLHLGNYGSEKASVWLYPGVSGTETGFATLRSKPGVNTVVPAELIRGERTWASSQSNITCNLDWRIKLVDGRTVNVSSIADDQEFFEPTRAALTYGGAITAAGEDEDGEQFTGFGLVEIIPYGALSTWNEVTCNRSGESKKAFFVTLRCLDWKLPRWTRLLRMQREVNIEEHENHLQLTCS